MRLKKIEKTYSRLTNIPENSRKRERRERVIDLSKYTVGFEEVSNPSRRKTSPKMNNSNQYERYLKKLEDGDLSKFSTRDIMFHFRDVAQRNGVKYVIGNAKIDMRNYKLALERGYEKEQVLAMIEFLFESKQNYLDKNTLHPGILLTGWCNTIFQDTQLWLDDKYVPKSKNSSDNSKSKREWTDPTEGECTIGEW